jgi:DNA-binding response OmpR family regulator
VKPDVVLLIPMWQPRALLRAQLIEEGFEVYAVDSWEATRPLLRPWSRPLLVIVDLDGLPHPQTVLGDLKVLMQADRVLVLTASGTLAAGTLRQMGFDEVLRRPFSIAQVVDAASRVIRANAGANPGLRAAD